MKLNKYLLVNKFQENRKIVVISVYESRSWSFENYWTMLDETNFLGELAGKNVLCCTKCVDNYGKPGYLIYVM